MQTLIFVSSELKQKVKDDEEDGRALKKSRLEELKNSNSSGSSNSKRMNEDE